jgi:tetratricopeptide (TPR) repeat protein
MDTHNKVRNIEAEMLFREGQQYQDHESFDKALETYQRAALLDPDRAALHFRIGLVLSKLGRWSEAEKAYLEVIRLEPDNPETHQNLGFVYYELGQDQLAQDAFARARQLGGLANPAGKMRF